MSDAFDRWAKENVAPTKDGFTQDEKQRFTPLNLKLANVAAPPIPEAAQMTQPTKVSQRIQGVSRQIGSTKDLVLHFSGSLSDADMRTVHEHLRIWQDS